MTEITGEAMDQRPTYAALDDEIFHALRIASVAHLGQVDKGGLPYITHPVRVAARLPDQLKPSGLLHDVIEDTDWTAEMLLDEGISPLTVTTVLHLSKRPGETNRTYHERLLAEGTPLAWRAKLGDLDDNLDERRAWKLPTKMRENYLAFREQLVCKLRP